MSSITRQLIDNDNNKIYPVTKANAVYMSKYNMTVQDEINEIRGLDEDIVFKKDGSIVREVDNGNVVTINFEDTKIIEVTKNANGDLLRKKVTEITSRPIPDKEDEYETVIQVRNEEEGDE